MISFENAELIKDAFGVIRGIFVQQGAMTIAIPIDPANADYQAYLAWLAEGNTPFPPDDAG